MASRHLCEWSNIDSTAPDIWTGHSVLLKPPYTHNLLIFSHLSTARYILLYLQEKKCFIYPISAISKFLKSFLLIQSGIVLIYSVLEYKYFIFLPFENVCESVILLSGVQLKLHHRGKRYMLHFMILSQLFISFLKTSVREKTLRQNCLGWFWRAFSIGSEIGIIFQRYGLRARWYNTGSMLKVPGWLKRVFTIIIIPDT